MDTIVLSGINLHSGGTLSIYYDMLDAVLENKLYEKYEFICYVYKRELFFKYNQYVSIIEIPDSKGNYLKRLYYENVYFRNISLGRRIYIWISVQDITPNVVSKKLFTYCHNPMMFYKMRKVDYKYGRRLILFNYLYKYVYKMNIKKNTSVVVQQNWIRKEFEKIYGISNVLVARPIIKNLVIEDFSKTDVVKFIVASQATFFKNFEIVCQAAEILNLTHKGKFKVQLTIDGSENNYSYDTWNRYKKVDEIEWLGLLPRETLFEYYSKSNCMIFPSRLETWGLPISEYKNTGKPIILADLPYAHETIGSYSRVAFFDPDDPVILADIMKSVIDNNFSVFNEVEEKPIEQPYVDTWSDFWRYVINC